MKTTKEYDSFLGGNQNLPNTINIMKFTAARSKEIDEVKKSLKASKCVKLAFQKLPKHMRRRVMSHNAKRLPRRLREIHLSQLKKSGMPPKQKRPSRKYRRRPNNLTEEFARRQRRITWLETHLWHAKRFHMIEKWGYKIPDRPCDKSFRACYRATSSHCLLQDVSYVSCIELSGSKEVIVSHLKQICKEEDGLSVGAKAFVGGRREGSITLYDKLKEKAIGVVSFNWKPNVLHGNDTLWIWVHAAFYKQVAEVLKDLFDMKEDESINDHCTKLSSEYSNIKMSLLKGELNRFRLTGPLSHAVLVKSLQFVNIANNESEWLKNYLENDDMRQLYAEQLDYWRSIESVNSPSLLSPHIITSMIVADPRYNLPTKRTKAAPDKISNNNRATSDIPLTISGGAIWDEKIRNAVAENKVSNAAIAELRNSMLIPGSDIEKPATPIPIMLIQRPGKNNSGYSCGWDIIIPAGWAQPFWMSFIMWGGRAGGLRECNHIDFETGRPNFLAPDTEAGAQEENELHNIYVDRFFKLPPNKRINYNKFAIVSPFTFNWKVLISDWHKTSNDDFCVLRYKHLLETLKEILITNKICHKIPDIPLNCLIPIKLFLKRGLAKPFSLICLPSQGDLKCPPVEKIVEDKNQELRKALRTSHKALLKRLSKKRKLARASGKKIDIDLELLKSYQTKMRKLWLPELEGNVRNSCSRQVMGFVTKGDFSYVNGQSIAVGYIAAGALVELLSGNCRNKVLVRNTNSRHYKLATLEIIV